MLFLGSKYLFDGGTLYWELVLSMSVSCVLWYWLLFTRVSLKGNLFVLGLLSVTACCAILFTGSALTGLITGFQVGENGFGDLPVSIVISFMAGMIGSMIFTPVAAIMGLLNIAWLVAFKRQCTE